MNNQLSSGPKTVSSSVRGSASTSPPELITWEFIWSIFMHLPRARSWLFDRREPSTDTIVQGFRNTPCLSGVQPFDFSNTNSPCMAVLGAPNIGELNTVIYSADGAVLGVCFGYKRIMPIIPMLYSFTKNRALANGAVVVRRTAAKYISVDDTIGCFVRIDFGWLESGVLTVTTSYHSIGPLLDQGEVRVFMPGEAGKLRKRFDYVSSPSNDCGDEHDDFIAPTEWAAKFMVREPEQFCNPDLLKGVFLRYGNEVEDKAGRGEKYEQLLGKLLWDREQEGQRNYGSIDSNETEMNKQQTTKQLWNRYHAVAERARKTGTFTTFVATPQHTLSVWSSGYMYMYTVGGIALDGRLRELFSQLGMNYSPPDLDRILYSLFTSVSSSSDIGSNSNNMHEIYGRRKVDENGKEGWVCVKCGVFIKGQRGNLIRHVMVKHHKIRLFVCNVDECGKRFPNRVNLNRHVHGVHAGRPFKCPHCTRSFKNETQMNVHLRKAHVEKDGGTILRCHVCGGCFDLVGTLNRHRRAVHGMEKGTRENNGEEAMSEPGQEEGTLDLS